MSEHEDRARRLSETLAPANEAFVCALLALIVEMRALREALTKEDDCE